MTLPDTAAIPAGDDRTFQVDLRGLVDLLSHHLYSSPASICVNSCRTRWTR